MQNNNSKLNTVLLIIIVILAAIGVWKLIDNDKEMDGNIDMESSGIVMKDSETKAVNETTQPAQIEENAYENTKYDFYVDIPGAITTESSQGGKYPTMIYEIKGNSASMTVKVPDSVSDWRIFLDAKQYVGNVTVGGNTFEHWTLGGEFGAGHYYVIEQGGYLYEISTSNQANLEYFGFTD